jgi:DNA-binding GntR family transcriptional regulator
VREALRRLESEGLVSYEVHHGSRVATVDLEEQEENLRVLAALEPLAAALASEKITESDLKSRSNSTPNSSQPSPRATPTGLRRSSRSTS